MEEHLGSSFVAVVVVAKEVQEVLRIHVVGMVRRMIGLDLMLRLLEEDWQLRLLAEESSLGI